MGLLDQFMSLNPDQANGLLAAGTSMINASGPSRVPVNIMGALGEGMGVYQNSVLQAKRRKQEDEEFDAAKQYRSLQIKGIESNIQRESNIEEAYRQAGGDPQKLVAALDQASPQDAWKLRQAMAPKPVEYDKTPRVGVGEDGKPVQYVMGSDGLPKIIQGIAPRDELKLAHLGGKDVAYNPFELKAGQTFQRTASPDSLLSAQTAMRGQNMTDARMRARLNFEQAQPRGQVVMTDQGPMLADPRAATARPITGPDGQPLSRLRPLPAAVIKQVQEVRDNASTMDRLKTSFKDNFAGKGVLGLGADAQLGAAAILGRDQDSVSWWKSYKKDAELVERHALFGASLTATEQGAWKAADISPGMAPETIKANLATRAELAEKVRNRMRDDLIDAGHSPDRISSIADRGTHSTPVATQPAKRAPMKGQVVQGFKFKGGDPASPNSWERVR